MADLLFERIDTVQGVAYAHIIYPMHWGSSPCCNAPLYCPLASTVDMSGETAGAKSDGETKGFVLSRERTLARLGMYDTAREGEATT